MQCVNALNPRQSNEYFTQIPSQIRANMDDMRSCHACNKGTLLKEQSAKYNHIPFVQIHTIDVGPQHNYGNSFRRPATNAETIKSEPIKSETSDGVVKENNNVSGTSMHLANATKISNNSTNVNKSNIEVSKNCSVGNDDCDYAQKTPRVFKCSKCHLLTLTQRNLAFHMRHAHTDHGIPRRLVACPGCENKFFSLAVLELHFREDHLMSEPDVLVLMNVVDFLESEDEDDIFQHYENNVQPSTELVKGSNTKSLKTSTTQKQTTMPLTNITAQTVAENQNIEQQQLPHTKSRIYLRNVECLREKRSIRERQIDGPHNTELLDNFSPSQASLDFDVLSFSNNDFITSENLDFNVELPKEDNNKKSSDHKTESILNHNILIKNVKESSVEVERKQKISIKSVELLCKPDMLQHNCAGNFINKDILPTCTEAFADFLLPTQTTPAIITSTRLADHVETSRNEPTLHIRPKIYIKNVDILKEPFTTQEFFKPTLSNLPSLNFNFLNTTNKVGSTINNTEPVSVFSGVIPPLNSFLTSSVPAINSLSNFIADNLYTHMDMDEPNNPAEVTEPTAPHHNDDENSLLENNILSESDLLLPMLNEHLYEPEAQPTEFSSIRLTAFSNDDCSLAAEIPTTHKISIKNVKVLKEPQIHEPRRTLHLRTVDELNLMNKREVESLIAPNLEQNYEQVDGDNFLNNTEIEDEIVHHMNDSNDSNICIDLLLNRTGSWTQGIDCDFQENNESFTATINPDAEHVKSSTPYSLNNNYNQNHHNYHKPVSLEAIHAGAISLRAIDELTDVHLAPQDVNAIITCDSFIFNEEIVVNDLYAISNTESMADAMLSNKNKNAAVEDSSKLPPPLVPMKNSSISLGCAKTSNITEPLLLLPPLVPVSSSLHITGTQPDLNIKHIEEQISLKTLNDAKIVNENLNIDHDTYVKSVRGRPYGPKKSIDSAKQTTDKKINKNQNLDTREKCTVKGCRYRFSKQQTLLYHQRCHTSDGKNERLVCPECGFNCKTWNALHTHLWRIHDIDMELYFCKLCSFKTPIYSRLANIHMKIHSDERDYKCEKCAKAFKNSKQLKNHRRWHRLHPNTPHSNNNTKTTATDKETVITHCNECMNSFPTLLAFRIHNCKEKEPLKCSNCDLEFLSSNSLKRHSLLHDESDIKRYPCNECKFNCTDYN